MRQTKLVAFILLMICGMIPWIAPAADPTHIYGIHDWGAGASGLFNGKSRWDVEVIRVGIDAPNLQQIKDDGFTVTAMSKSMGRAFHGTDSGFIMEGLE